MSVVMVQDVGPGSHLGLVGGGAEQEQEQKHLLNPKP